MDYSNIPLGLKITTQIPLDAKTIVNSEAVLSDLGFNSNLAFTYYDGMIVTCRLEKTDWQWREVVGLEAGLLTTNFTYPNNIVVNGITYSLKKYNFFEPKTLNKKVDKVLNKSLVLNSEIEKLSHLDDTTDMQKPVSTAQQAAIVAQITNSTIINNVTTSSAIPATGNIHALGVGPGTYTNWGGMVVPNNNIGTLQRVGSVYSVSLTPINFSIVDSLSSTNTTNALSANQGRVLDLKIAQGIVNWTAKAFLINDEVSHLGKLWQANAAIISTDVPGTSSKWVEILSGYSLTGYVKPTLGKNLYDKTKNTIGFYLNFDNTLVANASLQTSDYIAINSSTLYQITSALFLSYYDINKVFISWAEGPVTSFTTPATAKFVRFSNTNSLMTTGQQLEVGSVKTTFEEYRFSFDETYIPKIYAKSSELLGYQELIYELKDLGTSTFNKIGKIAEFTYPTGSYIGFGVNIVATSKLCSLNYFFSSKTTTTTETPKLIRYGIKQDDRMQLLFTSKITGGNITYSIWALSFNYEVSSVKIISKTITGGVIENLIKEPSYIAAANYAASLTYLNGIGESIIFEDGVFLKSESDNTCYVSSSTGSDTNDGKESSPFKTISFANSTNKTSILLKKGDVFFEAVNTAKKIGSYGEGNYPIISGFKTLINPSWVLDTGNIWKLDLQNVVDFTGVAGSDYRTNNIGFIYNNVNKLIYGQKFQYKNQLTSNYQFWQSEKFLTTGINPITDSDFRYIYMFCDFNPNSLFLSFAIGKTGIYYSGKSEVSEIKIEGFGVGGISARANSKIKNVNVSKIGGSIQINYPSWVRLGNAIEWYISNLEVENVEVSNCNIDSCYDVALTIQGADGTGGAKNVVFFNNKVNNCRQFFENFLRNNNGSPRMMINCIVENNIAINSGNNGFNTPEQRDLHILTNDIDVPTGMIYRNNTFIGGNGFICISKINNEYKSNVMFENKIFLKVGDVLLRNRLNYSEQFIIPSSSENQISTISQYRTLTGDLTSEIIIISQELEKHYMSLIR